MSNTYFILYEKTAYMSKINPTPPAYSGNFGLKPSLRMLANFKAINLRKKMSHCVPLFGMQSVVIIMVWDWHECKKCCQCLTWNAHVIQGMWKKCKFLSENLRNVLVCIPGLGIFLSHKFYYFFTAKNVRKSYGFMQNVQTGMPSYFFVESRLLNVLSHIGCQGMFLSMQDKH